MFWRGKYQSTSIGFARAESLALVPKTQRLEGSAQPKQASIARGPKTRPEKLPKPTKSPIDEIDGIDQFRGVGGLGFFFVLRFLAKLEGSGLNRHTKQASGTRCTRRGAFAPPQAPLQQHSTNIKSFMSLTPACSDSIH